MDDVDLLRTEIESGKQFKTALQGYDKKQVTETVTQLMIENAELTQQLEKARAENVNLKKQLRDLQREQAEYDQRERVSGHTGDLDLGGIRDSVKSELEGQYKSQIEELIRQLREAKAELAGAETRAVKAERALGGAESITVEAEEAIAQAEAKAAEAEEALADAENKAAEAEEALVVVQQALADAEARAAHAEAKAEAAEKKAAQAEAQAAENMAAQAGAEIPEPFLDGGNPKSAADLGSKVIVEKMKAQISKLNEEKRKKSLRIAELEDIVQQEKEDAEEKISTLSAINENMITVLQEKISELTEFTDEWKTSFSTTVL